jgi:hypothetical protein
MAKFMELGEADLSAVAGGHDGEGCLNQTAPISDDSSTVGVIIGERNE